MKSFAAALVRRRPSSLPVRGAWVEIKVLAIWLSSILVAPRAGSVG